MEVVRTHEAVNQLTSMPVVSVSSDGAAQSTFSLDAKNSEAHKWLYCVCTSL